MRKSDQLLYGVLTVGFAVIGWTAWSERPLTPRPQPVFAVEPKAEEFPAALRPYVRPGWRCLDHSWGDLNGDGRPDCVLVLEECDPRKFKPNQHAPEVKENFNPRRFIVLLAGSRGFANVFESDKVIPSASFLDDMYQCDMYMSPAVKQGQLIVSYQFSRSAGSWWAGDVSYKFRYQDARFRLVGSEDYTYHRGNGEGYRYSLNHLTGQKKQTSVHMDPPPDFRSEVIWTKFQPLPPHYLDAIDRLWDFHNTQSL